MASGPRRTQWFDARRFGPTRAGWYEYRWYSLQTPFMRLWTGEQWVQPAEGASNVLVAGLVEHGDQWRGLVRPARSPR